jgi:hypothetical protein
MRAYRVMGHELVGDLFRERGIEAATNVPNKTPTPAVIPMASAPQNVTRIMLGMTLAPSARAASAPKSARKSQPCLSSLPP